MHRRHFLKLAVTAPLILPARVLGREGPPPSERVTVGLIGLGGRCREIAKTCLGIPGIQIAAVCDCLHPRVDAFMEAYGAEHGWRPYTDFRTMIESERLDGVMVETTTHARAWVTGIAMAMGMDAYIEKPMCLTIAEGRELVNLARKYGRVTQVGTQQRSIPLNNWASDLVKHGALGAVKAVRAPNFVGPEHWTPQPPQDMPAGGNATWWDTWTNQAEFRPYHRDLHTGWSRWWDYDGGGISFGVTGWGTHSYDQIQRGLGTDETGPVEVTLLEPYAVRPAGTYEERTPGPDETGAPYYHMVRGLEGRRARVHMRYASGVELHLELDADRSPGLGCVFECAEGTLEVNRDRIAASAPELIEGPDRPAPLEVLETQPHIENWLECIKTRARCTADVEYGQRSSALCYLVNIARDLGRVGEPLRWDPDRERFTNAGDGNAFLTRPRRAGFEMPT